MWIGFILFVLAVLALDLGVFHRKNHVIGIREALLWSAFWIALGLAFSVFVYFGYEHHWLGLGTHRDVVGVTGDDPGRVGNDGRQAIIKYLTGYILEKSLSVDNIFVIALIFAFFRVPALYQHRVLYWGILGALIMRGAMIGVGATLIDRFHWILYIFGAFLIFTAIRMLFLGDDDGEPKQNWVVRLTRRLFPVTEHFHGVHFLVKAGSEASHEAAVPGDRIVDDAAVDKTKAGVWMLTPLALALVMVETTDLIFAVDSIPAIFTITADPFLVYTSNVFAILGLRSLYFALAGMMDMFRYLKVSLAIILAAVGVKMLLETWIAKILGEHFNLYLLIMVALILAAGVIASIQANRRDGRHAARVAAGASPPPDGDPTESPLAPRSAK
jgi:tellurite resistance protein TerC